MTLYVDSSAFLKLYLEEDRADTTRELLTADQEWVTANHTYTEVYRALHLRSPEEFLPGDRAALAEDWARTAVVALDDTLCRRAAEIAVGTRTKTLDALHLAAAERAGARSFPFLTYDLKLAVAARMLGLTVLGS